MTLVKPVLWKPACMLPFYRLSLNPSSNFPPTHRIQQLPGKLEGDSRGPNTGYHTGGVVAVAAAVAAAAADAAAAAAAVVVAAAAAAAVVVVVVVVVCHHAMYPGAVWASSPTGLHPPRARYPEGFLTFKNA